MSVAVLISSMYFVAIVVQLFTRLFAVILCGLVILCLAPCLRFSRGLGFLLAAAGLTLIFSILSGIETSCSVLPIAWSCLLPMTVLFLELVSTISSIFVNTAVEFVGMGLGLALQAPAMTLKAILDASHSNTAVTLSSSALLDGSVALGAIVAPMLLFAGYRAICSALLCSQSASATTASHRRAAQHGSPPSPAPAAEPPPSPSCHGPPLAAQVDPPPRPAPAGPLCVVCQDAPVAAALRPCFHAGYCMRCAGGVLARALPCPMCRAAVEGVQRIFLP
jgi:hypothetical protein